MSSSRSLTYMVATSADGYIAAANGDTSALEIAGDHISWLARELPETLPAPLLAALALSPANDTFDTVLMGWNTYERGLEGGIEDPYPSLTQYVFSTTHERCDAGANVLLSGDDPVEVARQLKASPGRGIWLCGGSQLATALMDEIDELVLKVNPVVLGGGIGVFGEGIEETCFDLVSSRSFDSGVVVNTYHR